MPEKTYDTPLVKKLGIKPASRVLLVNEPAGFRDLLVGLPNDVTTDPPDEADVIVFFSKVAAEVKKQVPRLQEAACPGGGLWCVAEEDERGRDGRDVRGGPAGGAGDRIGR